LTYIIPATKQFYPYKQGRAEVFFANI